MHATYLDPSGSQIGKKESIADTARVLGRMFDGIEYRGYGQSIVEELAQYADVPVWNGLTNEFHPTQILADFLTIQEHFGHLKGINFVYMGDARYNMGNSLMVGCAKMGVNFTACAPAKYWPSADLMELCGKLADESGATLTFTEDPMEGTKGADVIYTDVWVSMGEPVEVWEERLNDLSPYQVNQKLMDNAGPRPNSCTACPPTTTIRPPSAKRWANGSSGTRWRSPTRCSRGLRPSCSTRRKIGCIPLRP